MSIITKTSFPPSCLWATTALFLASGTVAGAVGYTHELYTSTAGEAQYSWNSRYAGDSYGSIVDNKIGASNVFYSGIPSDTQYSVGIFMIPISSLAGGDLFSATLTVEVASFNTWYSYGQASIGWLNLSSVSTLTGDAVADGLGPLAKARPADFVLATGPGDAGRSVTFDVTTAVQSDLAAGRSFTAFVLSTSRDTSASIRSAASGAGPYLTASSSIPEPSSWSIWSGMSVAAFAGGRRKRR